MSITLRPRSMLRWISALGVVAVLTFLLARERSLTGRLSEIEAVAKNGRSVHVAVPLRVDETAEPRWRRPDGPAEPLRIGRHADPPAGEPAPLSVPGTVDPPHLRRGQETETEPESGEADRLARQEEMVRRARESFESEALEHRWATDTEWELDEWLLPLREQFADGMEFEAARCRSRTCAVDVRYSSASIQEVRRAMLSGPRLPRDGRLSGFVSIEDADGIGLRGTFYLRFAR